MAGHLFANGFDFFEADPPLPWPGPILAPPLPTPSSLHQAHAAHHAHLRQHLHRVPSAFSGVQPFRVPSPPIFPAPPLSHLHRLPGSSSPSVTEQQTASRSDGHSLPWTRRPTAASRADLDRQPPLPPRPRTVQPTAAVLPSLSSVVGPVLPANWDFSNVDSPLRPSLSSDDYFPALLNADFSSPSIPPASPFAYRSGAELNSSFSQLPQQPAPVIASQPETSEPAASSDSTNPFKRERPESEEVEIPSSSPLDAMPALRKRAAAPTVVESEEPAAKRRRGTPTSARPKISPKRLKTEDLIPLDKDLFGSSDDEKDETFEMVDLVDVNENDNVIDPTPKEDKSIRLSTFQCVICMDDVQDLTVTYCGHLFCSECLHSSLHIDVTRKICPICRQKIELRKPDAKAGSRTYFALELKLMTRNRIGKRPAR